MTDRIKGLTVSLITDIREDDCEAVVKAIEMIYENVNIISTL